MIDGFTILPFAFCAAVTIDGGHVVVELGYISENECVVKMVAGDSSGESVVINEHDISVRLLDGGAEIGIDNLKFVIIKTDKV